MKQPRHLLNLEDASPAELQAIVCRAIELKQKFYEGDVFSPFFGKILALVFEKPSTRTRVSFEAGMLQLGGNAIFISDRDSQLGRGEPVEDTARVLSSMVDIIALRTFAHEKLVRFAAHSRVPVINALTDLSHPCQILADIQTFTELKGSIRGATVAWIGDGNNMCNTYMQAAELFDFNLNVACPKSYLPNKSWLTRYKNRITLTDSSVEAAKNADLITTDVWASMGQEDERVKRITAFSDFQVNENLMALAATDAIFLHCLPAHRGEEVTPEVIDGAQSHVWMQAENRLHSQKALMEFLLTV